MIKICVLIARNPSQGSLRRHGDPIRPREGLDDHPDVVRSKGHGALLYGSSIRVPWIVYNPRWQGADSGAPTRQRVSQTLRLLDVLPTLLDVLDVSAPPECLGSSAWPLALGPA